MDMCPTKILKKKILSKFVSGFIWLKTSSFEYPIKSAKSQILFWILHGDSS